MSYRTIVTTPGATVLLVAMMLAGLLSGGCNRQGPATSEKPPGPVYSAEPGGSGQGNVYRFAIHPLHNPKRLLHDYQPVMDYLNAHVPNARFQVEASRDYQEFERKIEAAAPDFLLPNPWQTTEAVKKGYLVIAMAGDPQDFKGLILARRDSGIREVADLRGKTIAYPSYTAIAACVMPQWFFHQHGLDVNRDITNRYVGSQESAIMNAYLRDTAVGCTWPPPWRAFQAEHPAEAAELQVLWETETLVNNSVMAHPAVPTEVRARVRSALLDLEKTEEGRRILAGIETARFLPATDADYDVVRHYLARFEAEVRPVKIVP